MNNERVSGLASIATQIDGINIYAPLTEFEFFYIKPSDAAKASPESLKRVDEWCRAYEKAFRVYEIFASLGGRFDAQFMVPDDLDLLAQAFEGGTRDAALREKARLQEMQRPGWKPEPPSQKIKVKKEDPGFVYLLGGHEGFFKIGKTKNIKQRLNAFTKLPFEVELICSIPSASMSALEERLHRKFAKLRANGEWFRLEPGDVEYIKALSTRSEKGVKA